MEIGLLVINYHVTEGPVGRGISFPVRICSRLELVSKRTHKVINSAAVLFRRGMDLAQPTQPFNKVPVGDLKFFFAPSKTCGCTGK